MVPLILALCLVSVLHSQTFLSESKTGRLGGFVSLRCGFSEVEWYKKMDIKDGKNIHVNRLGRRYVVIKDGTLYISRMKAQDAGLYTCFKHDKEIKQITVELAAKPSVVVSPSDVTTAPGALVHLPCEGHGNPEPELEWRVGRVSLKRTPLLPANSTIEEIEDFNGGRIVRTDNGHLYIRNVRPEDSGLYVCLLTNAGGTSYATSNVVVLDPPEITTKPANTNALDAEIIGFACRAIGNPFPEISWRIETFEGVVIEDPANDPSGRYEIDRYRTLRFRKPVPSDSGRYTCTASNTGGNTSATGILQVLITPQFRVPPKDSWVPVGQTAVFTCTVYGSPTPLIEWYKDEVYLPFSNSYQIQHVTRPNEVQERLVFRAVRFEDTGFYECRASNLAGTQSHEFSVAVTESMPFPGDRFVSDALDYAHKFVKSAIQETQVSLSTRFKDPNFQPTPQDLFHLVRQPTRQTLYMAMSAEVFEHALDYIHQQIAEMNQTSLDRNQQPLSSLLSEAAIDHLEDLSGCKARVKMPNCQMRCQLMSFRSHDGTCNNLNKPLLGTSIGSLSRMLPALYENKYNTPRGWSRSLPSPRLVSQRLISTHDFMNHHKYSILMMHYGQWLDHDMAQTVAGPSETTFAPFLRVRCEQTCSNTMPCFPIEINTNDTRIQSQCMPFVRSAATCGTGDTSVFGPDVRVRQQLNQVTSYIDGSTVYGSADEEMEALRDRTAGKGQLRVGEEFSPGKNFLPREDDLVPEELESERRCIGRAATVFHQCFLAGDHRSSEQPGLSVLHTLFMRQHNTVAYKLSEVNPQWSDDRVYEEARKIVGAMLQHIAYTEYLPKVLGVEGMELIGEYKGYDSDVNPTVLNEFATAAFRFGHTLIPPTLFRRGMDYEEFELGDMPLHNSFFTPYRLVNEGGIDPTIRGMIMQQLKTPDGGVTDVLTERLFHIIAQVSLDLASINIQRGRDHAIPTYNDIRQVCGMRRALSFHDLQSEIRNATKRQILSELYSSVDDIDLWVGGLEEEVVEGGLVGPTFRCIMAEQFKRTRNGDRFWYEADEHFTSDQLRQVRKVTLAQIFCNSGDNITKVPEDVFLYNADAHKFKNCEDLPKIDYRPFIDCGGDEYLRYGSHLYDNTNPQSSSTDQTTSPGITNGPPTPDPDQDNESDNSLEEGEKSIDRGGETVSPTGEGSTGITTVISPVPELATSAPKEKPVREEMETLLSSLDQMNNNILVLSASVHAVRGKVSNIEKRMIQEGGCKLKEQVFSNKEQWNSESCMLCTCMDGVIECEKDKSCVEVTL